MISNVPIVIVLGSPELYLYTMVNLINGCILTAPLTGPISSCLLRTSYSLRHNNMEIRPVNKPIMASKFSSERKSHTFLIINQKLEMIKLSEEVQKPR